MSNSRALPRSWGVAGWREEKEIDTASSRWARNSEKTPNYELGTANCELRFSPISVQVVKPGKPCFTFRVSPP